LSDTVTYTTTVTAVNESGSTIAKGPKVQPLPNPLTVTVQNRLTTVGTDVSVVAGTMPVNCPALFTPSTASTKQVVLGEASGTASAAFKFAKSGVYTVKVQCQRQLGVSDPIYVPQLVAPTAGVKGKLLSFTSNFLPPRTSVSMRFSDGAVLTGQTSSAGSVTLKRAFTVAGSVSTTLLIDGKSVAICTTAVR
jgi:hypothetical protein